eukprot:12421698-Karenia_brevis.AAC.1
MTEFPPGDPVAHRADGSLSCCAHFAKNPGAVPCPSCSQQRRSPCQQWRPAPTCDPAAGLDEVWSRSRCPLKCL